jgi:RHS repeat-associated protein
LKSKSSLQGTWYFDYDRENRLVKATRLGFGPDAKRSVVYSYDALGRRVSRQERKTSRIEFIYDGMDVIQDRKSDGSGTSVVNYVNGLGIDDKLKQTTGTTTSYYLSDHLGSTVGLADQAGSITSQTIYDSFGNATGPLPTRYGYTGREYDEYTGLMYYRARFYDPQIGRFISEDPIGFGGGDINLYAYVGNNPINYKDPTGMVSAGFVITVVAILGEYALHTWLAIRAERFYPNKCDPKGRKKHCYVNCMSTRLHVFQPGVPTVFSLGHEGSTLIPSVFNGNFRNDLRESIGDMQANLYGQMNSIKVWRSCYSICMEYPAE